VRALAALVLVFALLQVLVAAGQAGGEDVLDNPLMGLAGLVFAAAAVTALVSGTTAVVHRRDRSPVVLLGWLLGLLVVLLLLGELFVPH
jgi:hypothetical protein